MGAESWEFHIAPPLVNFGTDDQKKRFSPDVLAGKSRFSLGSRSLMVGRVLPLALN
jgi:hypothetical protein